MSSVPTRVAPGPLAPADTNHFTPPLFGEQDAALLANEILQFTPIPTVVVDAQLLVRHVSDSYRSISAANNSGCIGLHANTLFPALSPFVSATDVARKAQETGHLQRSKIIDAGLAWEIRAIPIIRDSQLRCIQMEFLNITADHQRQLELEENVYANETFRILVETVKDYAIFMLDPAGHVATWNAGAQAFKGYTKSEILGKHFSNFYSQEDRDNDKPGRELRDALRDGRCEDEGWRVRKDGSRFWANVVITPVYKDNILLGFSKVTRDSTERRKAETTLLSAYEESSKLKSEFLANMSHEIRTPMHGMLSALTLLLDTDLDPNQLELAQVIQESGDILLQVINDILDYSKLASGSFSISRDIISVKDIIQSVFRTNQAFHNPCVKLESVFDPKLPHSAEGDALRYRQIVQNLLSNAAKFTEEGSVRVVAKLKDEDEQSFTILTEVIDTGIGISLSDAGTLFTPFTQFDNSATKRYKGTGLGLSICKSLAELMGGEIGFFPNPDSRGSVFWFTAKLKKCSQDKTIDGSQGNVDRLSPSPLLRNHSETLKDVAPGKRLLLAEDNYINRKVMLRMLTGLGFHDIDTATNGREAVAKAISNSVAYDLILMDVNMPIQDGVSATRELRERGIQIPIIAMTANALKGQAEAYLAKGMTGYVSKPVDRNLLVKILLGCFKFKNEG